MHELEELFDEMIEQQKKALLILAEEIQPGLTDDDLLQPNDFPRLESHPGFRYEEGILAGLLAARMAAVAKQRHRNGVS
jgi:hypothetical protein